ncbi:MAG: hypothetical protein ABGY11_15440 [Candidatus Thioglobus sp.]
MDTVVDLDEEALMSRMISLLLNYPSIAYENDTVEVRVRKIEKSQVLLELIHLAEMDEDISQDDLIKPFQSKSGIYNRLKELCTLVPYLSETQARNEFLSALTAAEQHQKNAQIKAALASLGIDNPTEEQLKIMEGIQKGTYNNIEDELVEPDEPPIPDFSDEPDELDEPVERYVTEEWALGRIKDEKEWADDRVRDAIEDVEKEANRGFIAFLLVGLMILLFLSAAM